MFDSTRTFSSVALPVWTAYMKTALKGVPVARLAVPEGVTDVGGDWAYNEYANGGGVQALGVEPAAPFAPGSGPEAGTVPGMGSNVPAELGVFPMGQAPGTRQDSPERNRILDLFR